MDIIELIKTLTPAIVGSFSGYLYGYLFFREKRRALSRYVEAIKNGERVSNPKFATIFSLEAILRYVLVLGPLVYLIYKDIVSPLWVFPFFLICFWGTISIMTSRKYEN